ncbi:MAG: hypothetical protein OXD40_02920 [bacterium]|nr:hypothetical protein [bacterium]
MLIRKITHDTSRRDTIRIRRQASPSLASRINALKPLIPLA